MNPRLPDATALGAVSLTVADLPRSLSFYTERLGFRLHARDGGAARLGAGGIDILELVESPRARRAPGTAGLYHFAVLLPSRAALARSLAHLAETHTPLQGAADHRVSEALYLADPEGNGIEIYRDRPRDEWVWDDGALRMTTDPLDVDALREEGAASPAARRGVPEGTILGHVHLHVAHIAPAERFYRDVLGFDLTTRYGATASFFSAGGYHHHVACNTWAGVGAPPRPEGALGLREFVVRLPDADEIERVLVRVRAAGVSVEAPASVRDPSGNRVRLTAEGDAT